MVTSTVISSGVAGNGHQFIRVRDAAKFLSISPTQCRILADAGELGPVRRSLGKHRYLSARHVRNYAFNGDPYCDDEFGQGNSQGRLIAKIRVSSRSQSRTVGSSDKSSLDHQRERIIQHCLDKYGREPDEIIESVGSGLNFDRPEFLQLIKRIVSGELRGATIVATDFTRLCRFGVSLVEFLCDLGGVKIEYSMDEREAKSLNESLVDDILSIMTHFTAKISGNKARAALKVVMDTDSLKRAYGLYKEGYSYRYIAKVFKQEGRQDAKGRRYTRSVIRQNLLDQWEYLEKTFGDETPKTSFEVFVETKIRKVSDRSKLSHKRIMEVYQTWCDENGNTPMSLKKITPIIQRLGWDQGYDTKKCRIYVGLALLK